MRKKHPHRTTRILITGLVILASLAITVLSSVVGFAHTRHGSLSGGMRSPSPTPAGLVDKKDRGQKGATAAGDEEKDKKPKRGSLIFAPIPISSPAFGSGLILGIGYVFKLNLKDELSPPSTIGLATAFTNNG